MKTWFTPWAVWVALTRFHLSWWFHFLQGHDHWTIQRLITITEDDCLFGISHLVARRHWVLILASDGRVLYRSPTAPKELIDHYMGQLTNHTDWLDRFKLDDPKETA